MDRRLARHAVVALSRRGQGDQERRAAHRPRVAGRAVRLPRRVRRHLQAGQAHADHRQHPGPHEDQVLAVRLQLAVQGRRLLRRDAALHRQQVGHVEPGDAARQGLRRSCACARSAPTTSRSSTRRRSCARSPAPITTSGSTSSPTRCARGSSASSRDAVASAKIPVLDVASRYTELGEALLPLINPAVTVEIRARDHELHRRERVGAARSRSRPSTSDRAWPRSATSTTS